MIRTRLFWTAVLLVVSCWTLFYRLGAPNFYHLRNESRRAEIAREMIQTGNWLIPHLEEETILTKPPLFYWSVAAGSLSTGLTELTARIPSAVAGLGTVIFTLLIGLLLFGGRAAYTAAFALVAMNFFMHQARYAELESMLSFFVTASIYFFLKGYKDPARSRRWFILFFSMMGLGMMTKGPFALTFPLIPVVGYLCMSGELKLVRRGRFLTGVLFFLIIVLPWPLVILRYYPDFLKLVVWETAIRAATGFVHREPFHFYFVEIIRVLFPWIFVLPFSVWLACSRRLGDTKKDACFVLLWFAGNLLFLSILKSKRDYYLFPIAPAVALLVGATWQPLWLWLGEKAAGRRAAVERGVFIAGAALAGCSFIGGNPFAVNIPGMHSLDVPPLLFFIGSGMVLCACIKALRPAAGTDRVVFFAAVSLMLIIHFLYFTYTVPIRDVEDSGKIFYKTVARLVGPDAPLGFAWSNENYTFTFYARRQITTLKKNEELQEFMSSPAKTFLVMRRRHYTKLKPLPWRIVYETPYAEHGSWRGYVLLCNR